jgi:hypothetical protein
MSKRSARKQMFSLSPVQFRDSNIGGRGVFARRRFEPGDVIVPYAPKQRRIDLADPEAVAAADTKLTLLSEKYWVIIPDTSVPGGWLCNHSCDPNAAIYSDREGRIQCTKPILPGEEVTIFYGWVTHNEPERDPCRCGSPRCRGFINFDVSEEDVEHFETDSAAGTALRERLAEYETYLCSIGQEQVMETILRKLAQSKSRHR